jgi:hypothetical protein
LVPNVYQMCITLADAMNRSRSSDSWNSAKNDACTLQNNTKLNHSTKDKAAMLSFGVITSL